ncbi:hypothetical protein BDW62DRAFT_143804 [Aspergillus aurantiobrunneus]
MPAIREITNEQRERQRRRARHWARENYGVVMSGKMTFRRNFLVASLTRLITNPEFAELSDMSVMCRQVRFRCHKAIVCAQSKTIMECCKKASVRTQGCTIKVKCHPLVFRMALQYFYTCDYDFFLGWDFPTRFLAQGQTVPADPVDRLDCCELSLHLQVHVLATCLRIPGLKSLSVFKIATVLQRTSFPTVFPRFVREVYRTISKKNAILKRLVVEHADRVIRGCSSRNHFEGRFPLYLLDELEGFKIDFAVGMVSLTTPLDAYYTRDRIPPSHWAC